MPILITSIIHISEIRDVRMLEKITSKRKERATNKARFFIVFFILHHTKTTNTPIKRTETHLERTKAPKPTNLSSHTINPPRTAQNEPKTTHQPNNHQSNQTKKPTDHTSRADQDTQPAKQGGGVFLFFFRWVL